MKFKSLGFILTIATVLTASQVSNSAVVIGSKIIKQYRPTIAQENPQHQESVDRLNSYYFISTEKLKHLGILPTGR